MPQKYKSKMGAAAIFYFYRASYAITVLAVIVCLSVRHKSELYEDD